MASECWEGWVSMQKRAAAGPGAELSMPGPPVSPGSWQPCQAHIPDTFKSSPETSEGDQKTCEWGPVTTVTQRTVDMPIAVLVTFCLVLQPLVNSVASVDSKLLQGQCQNLTTGPLPLPVLLPPGDSWR